MDIRQRFMDTSLALPNTTYVTNLLISTRLGIAGALKYFWYEYTYVWKSAFLKYVICTFLRRFACVKGVKHVVSQSCKFQTKPNQPKLYVPINWHLPVILFHHSFMFNFRKTWWKQVVLYGYTLHCLCEILIALTLKETTSRVNCISHTFGLYILLQNIFIDAS